MLLFLSKSQLPYQPTLLFLSLYYMPSFMLKGQGQLLILPSLKVICTLHSIFSFTCTVLVEVPNVLASIFISITHLSNFLSSVLQDHWTKYQVEELVLKSHLSMSSVSSSLCFKNSAKLVNCSISMN